jgi:hypothetical protein
MKLDALREEDEIRAEPDYGANNATGFETGTAEAEFARRRANISTSETGPANIVRQGGIQGQLGDISEDQHRAHHTETRRL